MTATAGVERAEQAAPPDRAPSPYRNAAVVIAIAITMVSLFAISYSRALGRPTPHHIPAAIVGSPHANPALISALEQQTGGGLKLMPFATEAAARRAVEQQKVYAVLIPGAQQSRLQVASAAGVSVARLLEQAAGRASAATRTPLLVSDLHPLPSQDPQGLVSFYVTLAATILGFVTMFQLRAHAKVMPITGWLACVAVLAVIGGLVLSAITGPLLGALEGPFFEVWGAVSAQIAVAALFNCSMLVLFGRWAMIPTWGLFVAVGNASSGGAVAPPLLPSFYGFVGQYLPSGATVEIIRNAVYFRHAQHLQPVLVVASWFVAALAVLLIVWRVRGDTPHTR